MMLPLHGQSQPFQPSCSAYFAWATTLLSGLAVDKCQQNWSHVIHRTLTSSTTQESTNINFNLYELHFRISTPPPAARPVCHSGSDLHAVQCGAGAAHTAGPEAALLRQGPVAQGQQLTAQPQVLPAQPRLKATLGVLSEQLAASADVLSSELWEGRRAVSIVPAETQRDRRICLSTHVR